MTNFIKVEQLDSVAIVTITRNPQTGQEIHRPQIFTRDDVINNKAAAEATLAKWNEAIVLLGAAPVVDDEVVVTN